MNKFEKSILLITQSFPEANKSIYGAFVKTQAIAISKKYRIVVLVLKYYKQDRIIQREKINENLAVLFVDVRRFKLLKSIYSLFYVFFKNKISVVHFHNSETSLFVLSIIKYLFRIPFYITEHSPCLYEEVKSRRSYFLRKKNFLMANRY